MKFACSIKYGLVLLLFMLHAVFAFGAEKQLSADEIIQRALARTRQVQTSKTVPAFTYTKATVTEELDASGKVKQRKEKVYQVSFQGGATFVKLVEVNGRPPEGLDAKEQAENEGNMQKLTGKPKTAKTDNRDVLLTPELVSRFDFTLLGTTTIEGRPAYRLAFQPKNPQPPVHRLIDRFLDRISGTLCVDTEEFEIARADMSLGSEVSLWGGVAGCLKKLAYTVTRTRMAEGIWFNTFSTGDFEGRKLLDSTRIKTRSQSTNFRRLRITS